MTETPDKLLPCPFCGGEVRLVEGDESAYVQCTDMKMHRAIWFQGDNNAADEVREQWNRRDPYDSDQRIIAELRGALDDLLHDRSTTYAVRVMRAEAVLAIPVESA